MRAAILILATVLGWSVAARADDETACMAAIAAAERQLPVPPRALQAIAVVESGRPIGHRTVPWPWSINANGVGRYYLNKADAISGIEALRSTGLQSIDVGCMQVNLAAHPHAFLSLEDALDPAANVAYAARFFLSLYQQTGRWTEAMTSYHSQTPSLAEDYARRLIAVWPEAAAYGLTAPAAPRTREALKTLTPGPALLEGANYQSERGGSMLAASPVHGRAWPRLQR